MPKFRLQAEELADPLDEWCYFLVHGSALDTDNLPAALHTPAMERAMEVLNIMSQSEVERERYQARVKVARDERRLLRDLRDARELALKAREEGIREGLEKGLIEGVVDRIHLLQRLLKVPLPPRAELLAQSLDVLRAMAEALEQQAKVPRIDPAEPEA